MPDAAAPMGFLRDPRFDTERWIFWSTLIGIVAGCGAIGFDLVFRAARRRFLERI